MSVKIFNSGMGTVSKTSLGQRTAFITFTDNLKKVITATAPVTGVRVMQRVDFSVTKSLSKDFLISAFGDQPVQIVISGLSIYAASCPDDNDPTNAIPKFYRENRISTDLNKRVQIGIAGLGSSNQAFNCAVVGLDLEANSENAQSGTNTYTLTLVGVEL